MKAVLALMLGLSLPAAAGTAIAAPGMPSVLMGREIALSGGRNGATACSACHKLDGAGEADGAFPRIAGQSPVYLYQQLYDFAKGVRISKIMTPISAKLTQKEMKDVSAYYASITAPAFPSTKLSPKLVTRGAVISARGSASARIPACTSCHGPEARGYAPVYPYLAGQFEHYTKGQLDAFKSGKRRNDPVGVMRDIAKSLNSGDINALSAYFASEKPPPGPAPDIALLSRIGKPRVLLGSVTAESGRSGSSR